MHAFPTTTMDGGRCYSTYISSILARWVSSSSVASPVRWEPFKRSIVANWGLELSSMQFVDRWPRNESSLSLIFPLTSANYTNSFVSIINATQVHSFPRRIVQNRVIGGNLLLKRECGKWRGILLDPHLALITIFYFLIDYWQSAFEDCPNGDG